jgi:hypothetical protein
MPWPLRCRRRIWPPSRRTSARTLRMLGAARSRARRPRPPRSQEAPAVAGLGAASTQRARPRPKRERRGAGSDRASADVCHQQRRHVEQRDLG